MKWFEHSETNIRGSWMPAPYDNIFVGSDPRDGATTEWANQFAAIVNVSCTEGATFEPSNLVQRTYWYPLVEMSEWPYAYFLYMFKVIDHHYRKGEKIYIHCHAGAYRSPSIFRWWLVACENKSLEESIKITKDWVDEDMRHFSIYQNFLLRNLPPNFQDFIERIRHTKIHKAQMASILYQPFKLNKHPQVFQYHKLTWKHYWGRFKSKITAPFKRAKVLYRNWKRGWIEIKYTAGGTLTTDSWEKGAKNKPKGQR